MKIKPIIIGHSSITASYLILSALSVIVFALAFQDVNMLVFAIPILLVFILGASIDKGTPDKDLGAVGWSDKNMDLSVPFGILGGIAALFIGSLIMQITPQNSAVIVAALIPDFSSALRIASVIPPAAAVSANIIAQWLIVAPSEESLSKILAPFAGMSFLKNIWLAYIFGSGLWIVSHIPTFIIQGVSSSMYLVLVVLAGITLTIYFITKSLFSAGIAHGTFNTGVLVIGSAINPTTYYVLGIIGAILAYAWLRGKA